MDGPQAPERVAGRRSPIGIRASLCIRRVLNVQYVHHPDSMRDVHLPPGSMRDVHLPPGYVREKDTTRVCTGEGHHPGYGRRLYTTRVMGGGYTLPGVCTGVYHPGYVREYTTLGTPCIYTAHPVPAAEYTPLLRCYREGALGSNLRIVMVGGA